MGRHRTPDLPLPGDGADAPDGAMAADRPRARRRNRLATGLLGACVALAVTASTCGLLEPADAAGVSGEGAVGAWNGTLAGHSRHRDPEATRNLKRRARTPVAPSSSAAPGLAETAPDPVVSPSPDAGAAGGTPVQPASSPTNPQADGGVHAAPTTPATDCTNFVSVTGSDTAAGSSAAPWRTVLKALNAAAPGSVVCVRPGTYVQEVVDSSLPDGTAAQRVVLKSYDPANRAILDGRFSLSNLSFWTIRDLRFTNPTPTTLDGAPATDNIDRRIVSLLGGNDVVFENNEVYGGQYAGLLVGRAGAAAEVPQRYTLRGDYIHDTAAANLYFNTGRWSTGNLIERNIFANSATENVKIGWGDDCRGVATNTDVYGAGEVDFRYNTLSNGGSAGSFVAAEPGGLYDVRVHHNIFSDPQSERGFVVRYDSATSSTDFPNGCAGDRVFVTDNVAIGGRQFSEDFGDSPVSRSHEAGNVWPLDPQLGADYVPANPAARAYGYAAP